MIFIECGADGSGAASGVNAIASNSSGTGQQSHDCAYCETGLFSEVSGALTSITCAARTPTARCSIVPASHSRQQRGIRRTARRQREATNGRFFGPLNGPLPRRHRARSTRAAFACKRSPAPETLCSAARVGMASDDDVREAVSFTTTGGRLQRDRQLTPRDDRLKIFRWCFVERTLFA